MWPPVMTDSDTTKTSWKRLNTCVVWFISCNHSSPMFSTWLTIQVLRATFFHTPMLGCKESVRSKKSARGRTIAHGPKAASDPQTHPQRSSYLRPEKGTRKGMEGHQKDAVLWWKMDSTDLTGTVQQLWNSSPWFFLSLTARCNFSR